MSTEVSPISVYIAEGEKLYKAGDYKKAMDSFNQAIELDSENPMTYVQASKCFLAMGDASQALEYANRSLKNDKNFHKGIYHKAEALYSLGDFEFALVFYHRGQSLRPELQEFRLGVQKAKKAIQNSVGTPKSVNLRESVQGQANKKPEAGRLGKKVETGNFRRGTIAIDQYNDNMKKQRANSGRYANTDEAAQFRQKQKTAKAVLGEMYPDKAFLMKLLDDTDLVKGNVSNGMSIKELIYSGLNYLDTRTDFWQQHKPIYARKRDRELMQQKWKKNERESSGSKKEKQAELLRSMEQVEQLIEQGNPVDAMKNLNSISKFHQIPKQSAEDRAHFYGLLGLSQVELGQHTDALENHKKELEIAEKYSLLSEKSRALDNIGRVYARMGKFQPAIDAWLQKLPLAESEIEKAWLNHEIGRCFFELGKPNEAIEHGTISFTNAEQADDPTWQINAKVLIAEALQKSSKNDESRDSFNAAKELAIKYKDIAAEKAIENALRQLKL